MQEVTKASARAQVRKVAEQSEARTDGEEEDDEDDDENEEEEDSDEVVRGFSKSGSACTIMFFLGRRNVRTMVPRVRSIAKAVGFGFFRATASLLQGI